MALRIRSMAARDIPSVVQLQVSFLNGSIVTRLGPDFLARFHTLALAHPASRGFVAEIDGRIAGFALGSLDVHAFNAHMKPRILGAMLAALLAPSRLLLAVSLVRMVFEGEPEPVIPAELLLLTVDPRARRSGVGRGLLGALEQAFREQGIPRYRVAVRSQLAEAKAFYEALRFEHEQERTVLGLPMTYLTKQVRAPA
jgi:ribosomal protein S18 acetylase RimI-like enzyme